MKIYIDADACPVTRIAERVAKEHGIPVVLLCDTNHVLNSDYSEIRVIGAGADAVDIALINLCHRRDIVVTQDYGVAALALGKGAKAIHQSGRWYTDENIDGLLKRKSGGFSVCPQGQTGFDDSKNRQNHFWSATWRRSPGARARTI